MESPAVTLTECVHVWHELASSGALTAAQLDQLRQMFLEAAGRYDGTVSLLRTQTTALQEAYDVITAQTAIITQLQADLALARAQGPQVLN